MTATSGTLARGVVMRVTKLNACGAPVAGAGGFVVSDGWVNVEASAQYTEPEAIEVLKASGKVCAYDQPCPQFRSYEFTIEFCAVDPDLFNLVTGQPKVADHTGTNYVGYEVRSGNTCSNFAMEIWTDVLGQACTGSTPTPVYGYFLFPFVSGGRFGDRTFENGPLSFSVQAYSKDNNTWGDGPYASVVPIDAAGVAGDLLAPLNIKTHEFFQFTTIAPPAASVGGQALTIAS